RAGYCGSDRAPDGGAIPQRPRGGVAPALPGRRSMTPEVDLSSELAEARRRLDELESLVEISPVAIVVMDSDERVTGWNPAAAQLFGYSPQVAIGGLIDDLFPTEERRGVGRYASGEPPEIRRSGRT